VRRLTAVLRWDAALQARNGFYWASVFVVLVVGALLVAVPATLRADAAAWVPAVLAINLQVTTFFFVAALLLLERDEGTLTALAVSPLTPAAYLAARTLSLSALAVAETAAVVLIGFGPAGNWLLILTGAAAMGGIYTGFGAWMGSRYTSINQLLLPASLLVTLLLLPLLPHFGLLPRVYFLAHPLEPPLALLRAAYGEGTREGLLLALAGSAAWTAVAFLAGRHGIARLMWQTTASGGR
jgi:fluoroquinolone transport system permease protein